MFFFNMTNFMRDNSIEFFLAQYGEETFGDQNISKAFYEAHNPRG